MINPYILFGQPFIWPRGFKINDIGKDYNNKFFILKNSQIKLNPLIFQGIINKVPDFDNIIYQTRNDVNNNKNYNFNNIFPIIYCYNLFQYH